MITRKNGFTLIEITIAVLILSLSMVVLLGLLNSVMQQELRTKSSQNAMLYARRILANIEGNVIALKNGNDIDTAREILKMVGREDNSDNQAAEFDTELHVENWNPPELLTQTLELKETDIP